MSLKKYLKKAPTQLTALNIYIARLCLLRQVQTRLMAPSTRTVATKSAPPTAAPTSDITICSTSALRAEEAASGAGIESTFTPDMHDIHMKV